MSSNEPHRVLFVCMGNICRSPTGEGLFRQLVEEEGLQDHFLIDSAGTIGYHQGNPPDSRMRAAAARRGYTLEGGARQIRAEDFEDFDLVLAMDSDNYRDIASLRDQSAPSRIEAGTVATAELRMLSDFLAPDQGWPMDVPDPYYGGEAGFEKVLDMIEAACPNILAHLVEGSVARDGTGHGGTG
jgi:protein-tyrosine phosphatase